MVRLKAFRKKKSEVFGLFQFLMVRLKVRAWSFPGGMLFISIPYGSIKRFHHDFRLTPEFYFNSLWFD